MPEHAHQVRVGVLVRVCVCVCMCVLCACGGTRGATVSNSYSDGGSNVQGSMGYARGSSQK